MFTTIYNGSHLNNERNFQLCDDSAQGLFLLHSYEMEPVELIG